MTRNILELIRGSKSIWAIVNEEGKVIETFNYKTNAEKFVAQNRQLKIKELNNGELINA